LPIWLSLRKVDFAILSFAILSWELTDEHRNVPLQSDNSNMVNIEELMSSFELPPGNTCFEIEVLEVL
jgi:hypothetical protein